MASTDPIDKPINEKTRQKLEKFAAKQEKLKQQAQTNGTSKEKKAKKPDAVAVEPKDWVEETPAGTKKILKSLDDEFHKAYIPKVVESGWYSYWEEYGLFKPRTEKDGSLKPRGNYVIAIPPPNVTGRLHIGHALATSLEDLLIRWHRMKQFSTLCTSKRRAHRSVMQLTRSYRRSRLRSRRHSYASRGRKEARQVSQEWQVSTARLQ